MRADKPELSPEYCRRRQSRVRDLLTELSLDRAVFVSHENIQYLTGFRPHRLMQAVVCLDVDGECTLAAPNAEPSGAAFDRCVTFEAQWLCTLRQEQMQSALAVLADTVKCIVPQRIGIEGSVGGIHPLLAEVAIQGARDLDPEIWRMRRHKDPDELSMIRRAIACTAAMYACAREVIEPGISELEVYNQLHASAVHVAGEPLTALGNDFQCGSAGGPPRDRKAQAGELYILDLGPCFRGYYADNCRTISVDQHPTDEQLSAWQAITDVLKVVEDSVRPGVSCRDLFDRAKSMLDDFEQDAFPHHLGHGFGLYPHEAPHLNPNWDDVFQEGDCFTAEPGLYSENLKAGIRLEENYRVTATGVERLTSFPLEL